MIDFGDVPANSVLPITFSSYNSDGASVTLTGLAVTDVEIYKGTTVTQRSSDNGVALIDTDGIDIDGITGIHGFSIDTSDNSDAGFFAAGSFYRVIVSAVTIDAQTVNFIAATFRIVVAEGIAGTPKTDVAAWLGTAAATPTVAGVPEVDVTHYAGSTTDVSTIPSSVAAVLVDTGTTLQGELDGIQADTEDIQSRLPTALVNSRMDSTIDGTGMETGAVDAILNRDTSGSTTNSTLGAIVNDWEDAGRLDTILDARASQTSVDDIPTNSELATSQAAADDAMLAALALLNDVSTAEVQTAAAAAITAAQPIQADVRKVNNVTVVGDGSGTPFNV